LYKQEVDRTGKECRAHDLKNFKDEKKILSIIKIFSNRNGAYGWMQEGGLLDWLGGSGSIEHTVHHDGDDEQKINEKQSKIKV
jgi:hypothetical protein